MKKLLLFPLLLIAVLSFAQSSNKIIGTPFRIGSLEIAQYDFPKDMYWQQAKNACEGLGRGWRLPTKTELRLMFRNKSKINIGGHAWDYYWGYNEDRDYPSVRQNFKNGEQDVMYEDDKNRVRAVRTISY